MLFLLLLFLAAAHAFQFESQVILRRQSFADVKSGSDWVRVDLHRDFGDSPTVKRVYWCRTLVVPTVASRAAIAFSASNLLRSLDGPRSEEGDDCSAPGLLHMQLYPGMEAAVFQPETEPSALYIDPTHFEALWDEQHAMNVVVEMRINATTTAQQVTRFNQPHDRVPIVEAATTAAITPPPPSARAHPWGKALLFLCGGGVFFASVVAFRLYRQRKATMNRGALLLTGEETHENVDPLDEDSAILRSMSGAD